MKWGVRRYTNFDPKTGRTTKVRERVSSDDVKRMAKTTAKSLLTNSRSKSGYHNRNEFSRNVRKDFDRELINQLSNKGYSSFDKSLTRKVRKNELKTSTDKKRTLRNQRIDKAIDKNNRLAFEWDQYSGKASNKTERERGKKYSKYLLNNNKKLKELKGTDIDIGRREIEKWRKYGNPMGI